MISTNGTRIAYYAPDKLGFICYSTLHHRIELVTKDQKQAEYYVNNGLKQWMTMYGVVKTAHATTADRQLHAQWASKIKASLGNHVIVF